MYKCTAYWDEEGEQQKRVEYGERELGERGVGGGGAKRERKRELENTQGE